MHPNMIVSFFSQFNDPVLLGKSFLLSLPVCWYLTSRLFYNGIADMLEYVIYLLPGIGAGRYSADAWWESIKLYLYVLSCGAFILAAYKLLLHWS